jgi:hypothetical protein
MAYIEGVCIMGCECRQSMDMYASPALSIFSPSLNRISSSYLSSSYQRTGRSPHIQPVLDTESLQIPFLPGKKLEKGERQHAYSQQREGYAAKPDEHVKKTDADYHIKAEALREGSSILQAMFNGRSIICGKFHHHKWKNWISIFFCIWIFFGACEKKEGKNWDEKNTLV